jgi:hypothetical protein
MYFRTSTRNWSGVRHRRSGPTFSSHIPFNALRELGRRRGRGEWIEIWTERSAQPDDVPGDEHAGTNDLAAPNSIADVQQRLQRPPRIEDRRDAVEERDLRRFFDQILVAALVAAMELD